MPPLEEPRLIQDDDVWDGYALSRLREQEPVASVLDSYWRIEEQDPREVRDR